MILTDTVTVIPVCYTNSSYDSDQWLDMGYRVALNTNSIYTFHFFWQVLILWPGCLQLEHLYVLRVGLFWLLASAAETVLLFRRSCTAPASENSIRVLFSHTCTELETLVPRVCEMFLQL